MSGGVRAVLDAGGYAAKYGLAEEDVAAAMDALATGRQRLLAMSGKLGAGKDTVAPLLMDRLEPIGFEGARVHGSFAGPLRDELNSVIGLVGSSDDEGTAVRRVSDGMRVGGDEALRIVRILRDDVASGAVTSARDRTPSMRLALQYWGTEVRRAADPDYWVRRAAGMVVDDLSAGDDVFLTDARFPNELDAVVDLGGVVVRLEIGEDEQARRIMARDGNIVTKGMRAHPSETAADGYGRFTVVVHSDGLGIDETVDEAFSGIEAARRRR